MGNEISTESISEENFKSSEEYFEKNKKNNNFNKNNSEDLNKIYIIQDLNKDSEKIALKHSEETIAPLKYFYQNNDFNKNVSGHLMNLDFSDINEINDDYLFNNISSNNGNYNDNNINSKIVSQNMVCNNGQCKLRTKECVNGQCKFKDESFNIKRNNSINLSDDTNNESTSFKKFIQKYNQPFDDYDSKKEKNTHPNDKILNLHLRKQLNQSLSNPSLSNSSLSNSSLSYNGKYPLKEEFTHKEANFLQDSETTDEDFELKKTHYDSNYPDNSLSSISDVFWKKSVF